MIYKIVETALISLPINNEFGITDANILNDLLKKSISSTGCGYENYVELEFLDEMTNVELIEMYAKINSLHSSRLVYNSLLDKFRRIK